MNSIEVFTTTVEDLKTLSKSPTTDAPILTLPQRTVVLSEEFERSDQKVEALFERLKTTTGALFDSVLEVYNGNLEMFKTFLESLKAEENVEVIGNAWLLLAGHYQKVLQKFYQLKTEVNKLDSKENRLIPADIFDPATVKAIIDFTIERLTRLEKRSRQLADMHGADIKG
jgi:hypothetical protein